MDMYSCNPTEGLVFFWEADPQVYLNLSPNPTSQRLPQQRLAPGEQRLTIDVEDFPVGLYILRIRLGTHSISRTWIKK